MPQTDRFLKNVERWARFCPDEAAQLKTVDASGVNVADGLMRIGTGDEAFDCHNPERPLEEAIETVKQAATRGVKVIYVFGVGLGYMYEALKEWLRGSSDHQLVFLEEDPRVIKQLLDTDRGTDILNDRQVWLYQLDEEGKVLDTLSTTFVLQPHILLALQRYIDRNPASFQQTSAKISFLAGLKKLALDEYLQFGWGYFQNFFRNFLLLPDAHPASQMYGRFRNVPAIICGAGPSLKKNLHLLDGLKDRAIIFAGGTAMNAVNAGGVIPHFGVGIDPNPDQYTRLITNTAYETPYFYRNRLVHSGLSLIHGEHVYVPGSGGYGVTKWMEEQLGIVAKDITEGCNVVNFSVSIAAMMGCNPIICVGVDLAYSDEESYAPGILNHPIHNRREHFRTKNSQEELIVKPDIYGNGVYTLWKWIMESFWYTTFSTHNPSIKLINATEGGLGFLNVPNMPLQEVADHYLKRQYDFSGLIHSELQRSRMPPEVTREAIDERMGELSNSLERCSTLITEIHEEIRHLAEEHNKGIPIPEDMLSPKARKALDALEQEVAYVNFLKVFNDAFTKSIEMDNQRLRIDSELLGPQKIQEQKLILLARRYQFLSNTAAANVKHLREAVDDAIAKTEQLAQSASEHQPQPQPVISEENEPHIDITSKDIEKHERHDTGGRLFCRYYTRSGLLHGPFVHYNKDGEVVSRSFFVNGLRSGTSLHYYHGGSIASIQRFVNGAADGAQEYYFPDGTPKAVIGYRKGALHGAVKLYNRFGRLCRELSFVNGKRDGVEHLWNEEGLLVIEAVYKDGRPIDKARRWYSNGNLALETLFNEDGHALTTRKWNPSGTLVAEEEANNDDYFDKVTKETGVLTSSLDNVVKQLANVAPIIAGAVGNPKAQGDFRDIQKDIDLLQKEMNNLKAINQQLLMEAGMDPTAHKEPLWKSPSSRRELELQVEGKATEMAEGLSTIQMTLAKTLESLTKKLGDAPPEN